MTMNMTEAFDADMMTRLTHWTISEGSFDDTNDYIEGRKSKRRIWAVWKTGNKFSQFDEGIAVKAMPGGERYSDFKSMFVMERYRVEVGDRIEYLGKYYHVIRLSDEAPFGFQGFLLEKDKNWSPT